MISKSAARYFGLVALALACAGLLLFFEVIRPFRDMSIDGPIALSAWGIGVVLSIVALIVRARWFVANLLGLVINTLLLACAALFFTPSVTAISRGIDALPKRNPCRLSLVSIQ